MTSPQPLTWLPGHRRKAFWADLWPSVQTVLAQGWDRDELPEVVRECGRALGVELTAADVSRILQVEAHPV